jgi:hypothetical protein
VKKLQGLGLLRGYIDVTVLHPYRCQALMGEAYARKMTASYRPLSLLASLARSMGYLVRYFCPSSVLVSDACVLDRSERRDVL